MSVNGRLLNGCTHHTPPLLANTTMRWPGRAPFTRPTTGSRAAGPPASARGIVVNSIEGSTADRGVPHDIATTHTIDDANATAAGTRLVIHAIVMRRHSNARHTRAQSSSIDTLVSIDTIVQ